MKRHEAWFELDTLEPGRFLRGGLEGGGKEQFSPKQIERYNALLAGGLCGSCVSWLRDGAPDAPDS